MEDDSRGTDNSERPRLIYSCPSPGNEELLFVGTSLFAVLPYHFSKGAMLFNCCLLVFTRTALTQWPYS